VNTALQEDVQVIGLSILSGAHNALVPRVSEWLREKEMTGVPVIAGGIIPDENAAELKELWVSQVAAKVVTKVVAKLFQPGASLERMTRFPRESVQPVSRT
jgi:methylmalonyl-CoA mutase, C-terminal domain